MIVLDAERFKGVGAWVRTKCEQIVKLYEARKMAFTGFAFQPKDLQEAYDAGYAQAEKDLTYTTAKEEDEDNQCCGHDGAFFP